MTDDDMLTCPRCGGQMKFIDIRDLVPDFDEYQESYCCQDCGQWLRYEPEDETLDTFESGDEFYHWGLG